MLEKSVAFLRGLSRPFVAFCLGLSIAFFFASTLLIPDYPSSHLLSSVIALRTLAIAFIAIALCHAVGGWDNNPKDE